MAPADRRSRAVDARVAGPLVRRYWTSVREHGRRVRQHWWALVIAGAGAVLGAIALAVPAPANGKPVVATWLWLALLLGGIIVAQFLSFDEVRIERDDARRTLEERLDAIRYRFVMQALDVLIGTALFLDSGGPFEGYKFTLTFINAGLDPMYYAVEQMAISIGGHTADPGLEFGSADGILLPAIPRQFSYHFIKAPIPDPENGVLPLGQGEYTIAYGHPSEAPRYRVRHRFEISWTVTPENRPLVTWTDIGTAIHEAIPESERAVYSAPPVAPSGEGTSPPQIPSTEPPVAGPL